MRRYLPWTGRASGPGSDVCDHGQQKSGNRSSFCSHCGREGGCSQVYSGCNGKGCLATLSERLQEGADYAYIQIESSLQAVKDIAEFYLEQLQIPVVGITGSVGKTSTKEVIASVLKEKYRTLKPRGILIMSWGFLLLYSD